MQSPEDQLIPLSDAAKFAGCTPEHLNLLARQNKVQAQKIGRNWFTTRKWVDEHFHGAVKIDDDGQVRIELRRIEKDERVELARIQADVEMRRIEKDEKVDMAKIDHVIARPQAEARPNDTVGQAIPVQHDVVLEPVSPLSPIQPLEPVITDLKAELADIQAKLAEEQSDKQALLSALEHQKDQMEDTLQHRLSEMANDLNAKIQETKVTERLESLQREFNRSVIPAQAPAPNSERGEGIQEHEPSPSLTPVEASVQQKSEPVPSVIPVIESRLPAAGRESIQKVLDPDLHQSLPWTGSRDDKHKFKLPRLSLPRPSKRQVALVSSVLAVFLLAGFASAHPGVFTKPLASLRGAVATRLDSSRQAKQSQIRYEIARLAEDA